MSKSIKANEWYSLKTLVESNAFPWCAANPLAYRRIIDLDRRGSNILKTVTTGSDTAKRYRIKGEHVIRFLACVDDGTVTL